MFDFLKKKVLAKCCNVQIPIKDKISAFGKEITTEVPVKDGKTLYCHKCLGKMVIKCAWCGGVIFIGDPITLYSPVKKDFEIPEHAVIYKEKPLQLIGCLRWDCAETGADRMGFWLPPGKVERVRDPSTKCVHRPFNLS